MDTPHHRRDFVRTAVALAAPAAVVKADEPNPAEPLKTEVEARMELVVARFGPQLDDEARKKVRGEVEEIVRRAKALRAFALDNGDGPFPVFQPYRAPLA